MLLRLQSSLLLCLIFWLSIQIFRFIGLESHFSYLFGACIYGLLTFHEKIFVRSFWRGMLKPTSLLLMLVTLSVILEEWLSDFKDFIDVAIIISLFPITGFYLFRLVAGIRDGADHI